MLNFQNCVITSELPYACSLYIPSFLNLLKSSLINIDSTADKAQQHIKIIKLITQGFVSYI